MGWLTKNSVPALCYREVFGGIRAGNAEGERVSQGRGGKVRSVRGSPRALLPKLVLWSIRQGAITHTPPQRWWELPRGVLLVMSPGCAAQGGLYEHPL